MSRRTGFRRRWRPWRPSEAQRRVLDALVEGGTNAVIAGELGISTETVKWHVSELLAETGLGDRQALAQWWAEERERSRRPVLVPHLFPWRAGWLAPAALVVAVLVLVAAVAFLVFNRSGPESADPLAGLDIGSVSLPDSMVETSEPPETCEPPEALDLRIVRPEELLAEGLTPAGRLIMPVHCPLYAANRIDRASRGSAAKA